MRPFAPLAGYVDARVGAGTPVALLVAGVGVWHGLRGSRRGSRGEPCSLTTYVVTVAWTLSLAFVDGRAGLTHEIVNHNEYLPTARGIHDVPAMLRGFVGPDPGRCPRQLGDPRRRPPAGSAAALRRPGRASGSAAAFASALAHHPRRLHDAGRGAGDPATPRRRGRGATGRAVPRARAGGDLGGGVGRRGVRSRGRLGPRGGGRARRSSPSRIACWGWGLLGGLLLGCCLVLSYGLVLLAPLVLAVLLGRPVAGDRCRRSRSGAVVPVLVLAALGFRLWAAYPVLNDRYWAGIAADPPASYWFWGDLAALAISAGPALGAGIGLAAGRRRAVTARRAAAGGGGGCWRSCSPTPRG